MGAFPHFFIVYMNWTDKCNQADECTMIGNRKISLCYSLMIYSASTEAGLQRAFNSFAAACWDIAGIKISTAKTNVLYVS